jgi:hypothetical protein
LDILFRRIEPGFFVKLDARNHMDNQRFGILKRVRGRDGSSRFIASVWGQPPGSE